MNITARYAQHLNEENLQRNSIRSYISDVQQFLKWKIKFAPHSEFDTYLLSQYLRSSSFSRSPHTMRRKETSLAKFIQWTKSNKTSPRSSTRIIHGSRYLFSILGVVLLLIPFAFDSRETIPDPILDTRIPTSIINGSDRQNVDLEVDGVDVAVSGYEIKNPVKESPEVLLSLQDQYDEDTETTVSSLSPKGGTETIEKGKLITIIIDQSITPHSLITVTATAPTKGQTLYIQSQGNGYAVVAVEQPVSEPLPFNWISI